ncbi:hypothetical protein S7335_3027 [Synechococcus sp. PCC 7335]|nr:hypothetical protein S7335_3027 [Synechococcus sp. PCC 7335]
MVRLGTEVRQPMQTVKSDRPVPHPELLNDSGDVINEPLLVMRSISIKDARDQLNALYESSGNSSINNEDPPAEDV